MAEAKSGQTEVLRGFRSLRDRGVAREAKILIANETVVALGATARTYLTTQHVRPSPHATHYEMMVLFAVVGLALSLGLNAAALWTALWPLVCLERTARRVRDGDLGARVCLGAIGDPATAQLAVSFNAMLDRLRTRTRQVEAYSPRLQERSDRVLLAQEVERTRLATRLLKDTVNVGPGERYDMIWEAREPGKCGCCTATSTTTPPTTTGRSRTPGG